MKNKFSLRAKLLEKLGIAHEYALTNINGNNRGYNVPEIAEFVKACRDSLSVEETSATGKLYRKIVQENLNFAKKRRLSERRR